MQLGHSLLLQEYVPATEVDYGDCATFQVVCPNCREAIFKAGKLGGSRQYFSQYAASKANVQECELRVARITAEHVRQHNVTGHAQALQDFFQSFQERVLRWMFPEEEVVRVRRQIAWMIARQPFQVYADYIASWLVYNDLDKMWDQIVEGIGQDRSDYWMSQQKRFALDFLAHLLTPSAKPGWRFMCALAATITRHWTQEERQMLLHANDARLKKFLTKLRATPAHQPRGTVMKDHTGFSESHLFGLKWSELVFRLLLCIPYSDLLANEKTEIGQSNLKFLLAII